MLESGVRQNRAITVVFFLFALRALGAAGIHSVCTFAGLVPHHEQMRQLAEQAGLHYLEGTEPGITRKIRRGKPVYYDTDGKEIRDTAIISRLDLLRIPPGYDRVWISPDPLSHVQATWVDARGRTQYRYHPFWNAVRDAHKFERMVSFGAALPSVRAQAEKDLGTKGLSREKVLAAVVQLLERSLIRVGNEEYAQDNHDYGLTTLRQRHVSVDGSRITFHFRGKSKVWHTITVNDARLAGIVRQLKERGGNPVFSYVDESGVAQPVTSDDVNDYLRDYSGGEFSAKDYRTWEGTVLAAQALHRARPPVDKTDAKVKIDNAVTQVADRLGNEPATSRKSYIDPVILDAYQDGRLEQAYRDAARRRSTRLSLDERAVLALLGSY